MARTPKQRGKMIAERTCQRRLADGTVHTIRVGLKAPAEMPEDRGWHCVVCFDEPKPIWTKRIEDWGEDSIEALASAIRTSQLLIGSRVPLWGDGNRPADFPLYTPLGEEATSSQQRGKIIAERVFPRRAVDETVNTIRVGLEEPADTAATTGESGPWQCVVYIEELSRMKRFAIRDVDSLDALSIACKIALVFMEGFATNLPSDFPLYTPLKEEAQPSTPRGKIIAERVFQRHVVDETVNTIRVGLEEPVEMAATAGESGPWQCIVYIEESGRTKRIAMKGVDSMSALNTAFKIALVFIEGLSMRHADLVERRTNEASVGNG